MNIVRVIYMEMKAIEKWELVGDSILMMSGTEFSVEKKEGLIFTYMCVCYGDARIRCGIFAIPIRLRWNSLKRKILFRRFLAAKGLGKK